MKRKATNCGHTHYDLAPCRLAWQAPEIGMGRRAFPPQSPVPATQGRGGRHHNANGWTNCGPVRLAAVLALLSALPLAGCVAKRGVDFGHWSRTPERIEPIRVMRTDRDAAFSVGDRLLVLTPVGKAAPPDARQGLLNNMIREIQHATPLHPFSLDSAVPARYWREDNIADAGGRFDLDEIVRLGALFNAPYALCVHVNAWRPYPPQVLALRMTLVDIAAGEPLAELNGSFHAEEQQVVVAMDDWLQARRARKYDAHNLDILLRSPAEYSAFVSARCVQRLFEAFKNPVHSADRKGNQP